jgi:hypothetical protein
VSDERRENYSPGLRAVDLKVRDSLFMQKILFSDMLYSFECEFISFSKGIVSAKVVAVEPEYGVRHVGEVVTAKVSKCYLWGCGEGERYPRCHWFRKDEKGVWRVD